MHIAITGANRGIGLALTRYYLECGKRVYATCRDPIHAEALKALLSRHPRLLAILALDVTDSDSIDVAFRAIESLTGALDVLINNAGVNHRGERPGTFDAATMSHVFAVNSIGPMLVAQRALTLLQAGKTPRIVNISSQLGSLARKQSGGGYSYSASKAALNMLTKALAFDVRAKGITAVAMHPGWVQTDMGGQGAPLTADESVKGIAQVIDGLTLADTARFLQWDGAELPW